MSKCPSVGVEDGEENSPKQTKTVKTAMRKAKPKKRVILPDPVFNDKKVSMFVNHLMFDGK